MEKNTNYKRITAIIAYAILLVSGILKFVLIGYDAISTYKVNGFLIALIAYTFVIYTTSIKNKIIQFISYIITLAGYSYTFYSLYRAYDSTVSLQMGFYLYALSALILIISLFISNNDTKKAEQIKDNNIIDNSNHYVYGKYLFGIDEKKEYSGHRCAIGKKNNDDLILILTGEQTFNYEIKKYQVERITVTRSLGMKKNTEDFADHSDEDRMLGYAMGGALGLIIAENTDNRDMGGKLDYTTTYITEINYKIDNESKKILLELDNDPHRLFESFNDLFIEKA